MILSRHAFLSCLFILSFASTAPTAPKGEHEPIYEGLGQVKLPVTTSFETAKKYFHQGLAFLYGFNHGAAIRSFSEAAKIDPSFAMAHWGIALAHGPHINLPMVSPASAEKAVQELKLAKKYSKKISRLESDLIRALQSRYVFPQPEDRSSLDRAYADAMRTVWHKHSNEADVGVLFAESLMDLRPWDQWTPDGKEQPGTKEVIDTLNAVLKLDQNHPFANHLYIHAVEASPHPEWAIDAAERLRTLQPGLAHNVHMPSHIDIRTGRWQKAIETNLNAVKADEQYREIAGEPDGFLPLYVAHNQHMLVYAAMMTGQKQLSLDHIRAMLNSLPKTFLRDFALQVEGYAAMPLEVMVRFGMWDEILAEPDSYAPFMKFSKAFHYAARAIAFAAKKDTQTARKEQVKYLALIKEIPNEETFGNNSVAATLEVLTPMLDGEILLREGKTEEGLSSLEKAVKADDALRYDEPPGWLIPVRHSLGAALMKLDRYAEAELVYREDLKRLPVNGWSLYGLYKSLREQNKNSEEAKQLEKQFREIWANADISLTTSCLCQKE